jgi:uncharacterized protein (TIGR02246 family)
MKLRSWFPALVAGSFGLVGCFVKPSQAADLRMQIEAADVAFAAAAAKRDSAALATLYTEDAQIMPSGTEPLQGRHAIQQFWRGALESGIAKVDLQTLEVFGLGIIATEVGHYELHDKTGTMLDSGKYIVIWRYEDGRWKLHRDMFSTDLSSARK